MESDKDNQEIEQKATKIAKEELEVAIRLFNRGSRLAASFETLRGRSNDGASKRNDVDRNADKKRDCTGMRRKSSYLLFWNGRLEHSLPSGNVKIPITI